MEEIGLAPNLYAESRPRSPRPARPARPAEAPEEPHAVFVTPSAGGRPIPAPLDAEPRHRVDEAEFDLSDADPLSEVLGSQPDAAEPSEAVFEEEFFDALVETVKAAGSETAPEEPSAPPRAVRSPLFDDFTDEEFIAIAAQMELHSFGAGDIVITEGDPGDSLFVLTTGVVKAFVRNSAGRHVLVREMGEGSFFGEISILTRKPRTATVTCATSCDLLELDRDALDGIAAKHPRVHQVLLAFLLPSATAAARKSACAARRPRRRNGVWGPVLPCPQRGWPGGAEPLQDKEGKEAPG